jgi:ABC-type transport system substrate-binding protein
VPEFDADGDDSYIRRDLTAARALLRDNQWTADNLPILDYGFPNSVTERQIFEQFRNFMAQIGYPAGKIRPMIFATYGDYQRAYSQGKVTLINSSWTMDYPDAENIMQLFYGPNAAPGSNSASYDNPEYNRLFDRAASMQESSARTRLYRRMNRLVMQDCATISGLSRTLLLLWDKNVIMQPDRSFVGGYFLRFVDVEDGNGHAP